MMNKRRYKRERPNSSMTEDFLQEIRGKIDESGIKNAVCVLLGDGDKLTVISADPDDSFQLAGILDLGKSCLHNDVLEGDEE